MRTLRVLARLLVYPDADLKRAVAECRAALAAEAALAAKSRSALDPLLASIETGDLLELQEAYVSTFDLGRGHSLHLFEHVYGDSRERGQAMVALAERYGAAGLNMGGGEFPDFLPLVLEYASVAPAAEARALLEEIAHVVDAVGARLERRGSPYAAVFQAVGALAGRRLHSTADLVSFDDDDSPEARDRAWAEAAVTFGPENAPEDQGGCERTAAMVSRLQNRI